MDLKAYEHLIRTESAARKFMLGFCWKNHQRFCPKCRQRKLYRLTDGRRRCSRCGYTFQDFSGRWINLVDLDCGQWLRLIKLFELEISSRKIAQQLSVSYKVAHRAVMVLRGAIMAHAPDAQKLLGGEVEIDESYFGGKRKGKRGRGASGKVPVFGILERDGLVHVEAVPNVRAETLLGMTIKKVRRGSIVYTDKFRVYDSLMFCGYRHLKVDHGKRVYASGKVYINGLEGFWSFAKERLIKHHGVSRTWFPYYLKELEFRYNNRRNEIFNVLCQYICDFIPLVPDRE